ncbi:MAG TPA: hypothetical protein VHM25_01290, partial [Polyangiaceae bacterium]|nr:hypothetical protein [Polyangiaceae bacterium]
MRATLGVWIAGALVASCGAKSVDLGGDPVHSTGGAAATTGGAANPSNTATGGGNRGGEEPAGGNASYTT